MHTDAPYLDTVATYLTREQPAGRSAAFSERQTKALAQLLAQGLPTDKQEAYRRTPFTRKLTQAAPYGGSAPPAAWKQLPALPFAAEKICVRLLNNQLAPEGLPKDLPKGLHISSFDAVPADHQARFAKHAFSSPLRTEDAFVMLNEAAFEYGLFVYVAPNTKVQQPLLLHQHAYGATDSVATHPRLFVYVDKGASLRLLDMQTSSGEGIVHQNSVSEIICAEGAEFSVSKVQQDHASTLRIDHTYVEQYARSKLHSYVLSAGADMLRNNLYVSLCEEDAHAALHGFYLCDQKAHIDNHTTLNHCVAQTYSDQSYKGILGNRGRGVFNGRIFMRPGAAQSTAYQSNRNLLLSPYAKIHTKPQLEIWVDDVRCSHGCTVGQLSAEQLFYLQARGVPKPLAEEMLLFAFAEEVFADIPEQGLVEYVRGWLHDRFQRMLQ